MSVALDVESRPTRNLSEPLLDERSTMGCCSGCSKIWTVVTVYWYWQYSYIEVTYLLTMLKGFEDKDPRKLEDNEVELWV